MATVRAVSEHGLAITVLPPNHEELVAAFRAWAVPDADLRVLFTPDVLIAIDNPERRGYLFDDGWTVEVWVDRGVEALLGRVNREYVEAHCEVERPRDDASNRRSLHEMAMKQGSPVADVRHLL